MPRIKGAPPVRPARPLPDPADEPTLPVPEGGTYLGLGRAASYNAARRGTLPVIKLSERNWVVPTAELRRILGVDQ